MTTIEAAVRAEHLAHAPKIDELRRLADELDDERPAVAAADLDRILLFLDLELLPHAAAEDAVLYVAVGELLGDERATETMRRDHVEIRRLVAELHQHRDDPRALRRLLYGLHAVLTLHVAKEDELYLPLLSEGLTGAASEVLLHAMHRAVEDRRTTEALAG